jgi:hypothetical protein
MQYLDNPYKTEWLTGSIPIKSKRRWYMKRGGSSLYDAAATALFARMVAAGDTPSDGLKTLFNTAIKASKTASLWDGQFDYLRIYRQIDAASAKLNIVRAAFDATIVNTITFTTKLGFYGGPAASYIRSNYIPSSDKINLAKNDACYGIKVSGAGVGESNTAHGGGSGVAYITFYQLNATTGIGYLNNGAGHSSPRAAGYNCLSRIDGTTVSFLLNSDASVDQAKASVNLPSVELYSCGCNETGTASYLPLSTEKLEMEWIGKSLSRTNFLIFQSIWDAFFTGLAAL